MSRFKLRGQKFRNCGFIVTTNLCKHMWIYIFTFPFSSFFINCSPVMFLKLKSIERMFRLRFHFVPLQNVDTVIMLTEKWSEINTYDTWAHWRWKEWSQPALNDSLGESASVSISSLDAGNRQDAATGGRVLVLLRWCDEQSLHHSSSRFDFFFIDLIDILF